MPPSPSDSPRKPFYRGISPGHPLVWLAITLVLLGAGYAWLSAYIGDAANSRDATAVRKLTPENSPRPPAAEAPPVEKEAEMSITRSSDEERVETYLEYEAIEQQILPLLDAADVQFEAGQFVQPPGNNAWESYQAILEIDPSESVALAGLTKIKSQLIANAEDAIDAAEFAEAENWLVQLDQIQPGDPAQVELREEISALIAAEAERRLREQEAEELQRKIDTAISQAEQAESETPVNYNEIKDLYDRVLELEPGNDAALAGLERLADLKLDEVENWLHDGELELAATGLEAARRMQPGNRRISALQLALNASQRQQTEEEARRLAEEEALRQQQEAELERERQVEEQAEREAEAQRLAEQQAADEAEQGRLAEEAEQRAREEAEEQARQAETPSAPAAAGAVIAQGSTRTPPASGTSGTPVGQGVAASARESAPEPTTSGPPVSSAVASNTARDTALREGIRAYYAGDYNRSFELLYPLAEDGVPRAEFRIGIMYQFGRSVARNPDLAEKWFTAALPELLRLSQQGVAWAQADLGTAYEFGIALQQDYERAAYWYRQAADRGYAGAQTNLGVLYAQGDGVPYDRSQAIFWLRKAAEQGDRVARENLRVLGIQE